MNQYLLYDMQKYCIDKQQFYHFYASSPFSTTTITTTTTVTTLDTCRLFFVVYCHCDLYNPTDDSPKNVRYSCLFLIVKYSLLFKNILGKLILYLLQHPQFSTFKKDPFVKQMRIVPITHPLVRGQKSSIEITILSLQHEFNIKLNLCHFQSLITHFPNGFGN